MQPRLDKTKLSEAQVHHNRVEFLKTRIANLKRELALREAELERKTGNSPASKEGSIKNKNNDNE